MGFENLWEDRIPGTARPLGTTPTEPTWVTNHIWCRDFEIDGPEGIEVVRYYTIGALAAALGKSQATVRRWIARRIIPDSGMRTMPIVGTIGDAGRRLWTRPQIETLVTIAEAEGVIGAKQKKDFNNSAFASRVWATWRHNDW